MHAEDDILTRRKKEDILRRKANWLKNREQINFGTVDNEKLRIQRVNSPSDVKEIP